MASRHSAPRLKLLCLSLGIVFLTITLSCPSIAVDIGGLSFDAELGFGGYFRPGSWVPVRVELANEGFPLDAFVEVVTQTTNRYPAKTTRVVYRRPVSLPTGARKKVNLNVPITETYYPLDVRLVQSDGSLLDSVRFSLREGGVSSDIILVLDPSGERWTWLQEAVQSVRAGNSRSRVLVVHLRSEEEMPVDWVAFESVRTVILTDAFPFSAVSPAQLNALLQWVEAGGHLLVAGGAGLDALRVPQLRDVLPVDAHGGTSTVSVTNLGTEFVPLPKPITLVAWNSVPGHGQVTLSQSDIPLLAWNWLGTGRITYIGFDLSAKTFRQWESLDWFSRTLVLPSRMVRKASTRTLEQSLLPLLLSQRVSYPQPLLVAVFLGVYAGVFGLALYITRSKAYKIRRAAWCLVVAATFLVSAMVPLAVGPSTRRAMRAYGEIRVSQVPPGEGAAHSFAVAQIVDLHGGAWPIQRDAGVYIAPSPASGTAQITALNVVMTDQEVTIGPTLARQPQAVTSHALIHLPIYVSAKASNLDLHITVDNQTEYKLRTTFYVDRTRYKNLGTVQPQGSLEATFPADEFVTASGTLSPEWIASSVASVASRYDSSLKDSQRQALTKIVTFALTPDSAGNLPWGNPFIVGMLETPVKPPLTSRYTGTGFHFVVIPMASALKEGAI